MKLQSRKDLLFSQELFHERKVVCKWSLWFSSGQYFKNVSLVFLYVAEFSRALSMYLAVHPSEMMETSWKPEGCILSQTWGAVSAWCSDSETLCPVGSALLRRALHRGT